MSAYTNKTQVEAYLQRPLTVAENSILSNVIEAVSKYINTYTDRLWRDLSTGDGAPDAETTRFYDGNGHRELFIDDFEAISELVLLDSSGNETYTVNLETEVILYPQNTEYKTSIYLRNMRFPLSRGGVRIKGSFVTGDVPSEVQLVAASLVGIYFSQAKSSSDDFKSESIEGYSYSLMTGAERDDRTRSLLEKLDGWKKIVL